MAPFVTVFLTTALLGLVASENLIENGAIRNTAGWSHTGDTSSTRFTRDHDVGAERKGSLLIKTADDASGRAHNWRQSVLLPDDPPSRLELRCAIRVDGLAPDAAACLVANIYDADNGAQQHVRCPDVREETDWRVISCVFDVPEGAERVHLMAYLVGDGSAWFDDFALIETDKPVTTVTPPAARDSRYATLARGAAADLPWRFDAATALDDARRDGRPLLLYVRCTDDTDHLRSAETTVEAAELRLTDDGYAKDLVFRAGVLSEPAIHALISRRFVPVIETYVLHKATHGAGSLVAPWTVGGTDRDAAFVVDDDGDRADGALGVRVEGASAGAITMWSQSVPLADDVSLPTTLRISGSVKATSLDGKASVLVQCWKGSKRGRVRTAARDDVADPRLAPRGDHGRRPGRGRSPECARLPERRRRRPLRRRVDRRGGGWARPRARGERRRPRAVAPRTRRRPLLRPRRYDDAGAARVRRRRAGLVRRLHRFGAVSADLVDHWLRGVLDELGARPPAGSLHDALLDGDLVRVERETRRPRGDDAKLAARRRAAAARPARRRAQGDPTRARRRGGLPARNDRDATRRLGRRDRRAHPRGGRYEVHAARRRDLLARVLPATQRRVPRRGRAVHEHRRRDPRRPPRGGGAARWSARRPVVDRPGVAARRYPARADRSRFAGRFRRGGVGRPPARAASTRRVVRTAHGTGRLRLVGRGDHRALRRCAADLARSRAA